MADPVLTTLCGICRATPPKYCCPRCHIQYCSVDCYRRHRARAGCSGARDQTAFVPRQKLCTAAGLDHDYNFLHGIEMARVRNERHFVDERQLLRSTDLRPRVLGEDDGRGRPTSGRGGRGGGKRGGGSGSTMGGPAPSSVVLHKEWIGNGALRFVPAVDHRPSRPLGIGMGMGGPSKKVQTICRRDGITLLCVPSGLARQRDNTTTVATVATGPATAGAAAKPASEVRLHWQVEWLVYTPDLTAPPTRVLRRLLDHVPLCRGYASMQAWSRNRNGIAVVAEAAAGSDDNHDKDDNDHDNDADGPSKKRRGPLSAPPPRPNKRRRTAAAGRHSGGGSGGGSGGHPLADVYAWQDPATGAWGTQGHDAAAAAVDQDSDQDDSDTAAARRDLLFFLLRPRPPPGVGRGGVSGGGDAMDTADRPPTGKELIPLAPGDTLATALRGRSVLEFPTIHVLPRGATTATGGHKDVELPPGYVLGSTERRVIRPPAVERDQRPTRSAQPALAMRQRRMRESVTAAADSDSGTSSEGTSSEEDDEDEDEDEDDTDDEDEDDDDDDDEKEKENAHTGKVVDQEEEQGEPQEQQEEMVDDDVDDTNSLPGLGSKPKLVVYDSWSEGSDQEVN